MESMKKSDEVVHGVFAHDAGEKPQKDTKQESGEERKDGKREQQNQWSVKPLPHEPRDFNTQAGADVIQFFFFFFFLACSPSSFF